MYMTINLMIGIHFMFCANLAAHLCTASSEVFCLVVRVESQPIHEYSITGLRSCLDHALNSEKFAGSERQNYQILTKNYTVTPKINPQDSNIPISGS
jgi:hypothetical protein